MGARKRPVAGQMQGARESPTVTAVTTVTCSYNGYNGYNGCWGCSAYASYRVTKPTPKIAWDIPP